LIYLFKVGFLNVGWVDVIDIALVSFLLYQVYKLMKGSVAVRIFLGFLSLYLLFLVTNASGMELFSAILGQFMGVGVLAVIILFQQEIRKFLLMIGKSTTFSRENILKSFNWKRGASLAFDVTSVIEAVKSFSGSNTGALIVFSKNSPLKFYAESGDILNAEISKRLLLAIFNKSSPLHDGAVIVYDGKIKAARCILPVSENDNLPAQFGLRHRAAVGMSEVTDTLVLVVSEETGQTSTTRNGEIVHNLSSQELTRKISEYFTEESSDLRPEEVEEQPMISTTEDVPITKTQPG